MHMQEVQRERKLKFFIFDQFSFTVVILNSHICHNTGYDTGIVGCSVKSSGMLERRAEDCFVTFRFDCIYLCANWVMVEILCIYFLSVDCNRQKERKKLRWSPHLHQELQTF